MKLKLIATVAAIALLPLAAQAQPKPKPPTKADAVKVVNAIKGDKAKVKAYCDMGKLSDQAAEADQKKDTKKADELAKQMDELGKQLGPEFNALMDAMQDMDPNSKAVQDINATLEDLDKLCGNGK